MGAKTVPPTQEESITISDVLRNVARCPHCGVANPLLSMAWKSDFLNDPDPGAPYGRNWAAFVCSSCNGVVLARSKLGNQGTLQVENLYPEVPTVADELPPEAKRYLAQAIESLHSPDGAAMLAGSAVDRMWKEKGLEEGSVHVRIEQAVEQNIITRDMAEWAHEVRLGSNRPRHADSDRPHVSREEAAQSVEFARVLGHVLFVLPDRVARGREAVTRASGTE